MPTDKFYVVMKRLFYIGVLMIVMLFVGHTAVSAHVDESCETQRKEQRQPASQVVEKQLAGDEAILPETLTLTRVVASRMQRSANRWTERGFSCVLRSMPQTESMVSRTCGRCIGPSKDVARRCLLSQQYYVIQLRRILR